ncbi:MAG: metal-dependent hydrolase [Bacteroidetes bacterium]|nr:metal-dependent hydrolase [Bacteroidota bacterium]
MDSLTHIVLGAAIGDRILGKKIGRKAAWIGAFAKTFPDFDLLYSGLNDLRKYILYHRSYTHSFL